MAILWMLVGMVLLVLIDTLVRTVFSHFRHIGSELTVEEFFFTTAWYRSIAGGLHGHRLELSDINTRWVVEFRKEIPDDAPTRYYMTVRRSDCGTEEFAGACRALEDEGIELTLEQPEDEQSEALIVNIGQDIILAERAARTVLLDGFGLNPESYIRSRLFGGMDYRLGKVHGWTDTEDSQAGAS